MHLPKRTLIQRQYFPFVFPVSSSLSSDLHICGSGILIVILLAYFLSLPSDISRCCWHFVAAGVGRLSESFSFLPFLNCSDAARPKQKGTGSGVWWRDQNTFSRHSGGPALGARDRFVGRSNKGRPPRPHPPKKPCADLFELRSQCVMESSWMIRESSCRYFPLPCGVSAYTQLSRRRKRLGFGIYQMSGPRGCRNQRVYLS